MPASLHKILYHSKNIIMTLPLSPGFFGEEGAELVISTIGRIEDIILESVLVKVICSMYLIEH